MAARNRALPLSYDMAQILTPKDNLNGERNMLQKTDSQNKYNLILKVHCSGLME
jgi:hypothetical protein